LTLAAFVVRLTTAVAGGAFCLGVVAGLTLIGA
jgi:hypothetical protein